MNTNLLSKNSIRDGLALVVSVVASELVASPSVAGPCQLMIAQKQRLSEMATQQEAALAGAIAKMNEATGEEKSTLMAAVISLLVQQRVDTQTEVALMEQRKLVHLIQHLESGLDSLVACPMLNDASGKPSAPTLVGP